MIKFFLKLALNFYNLAVFVLLNVVMFFNHMWRPRRWTPNCNKQSTNSNIQSNYKQ